MIREEYETLAARLALGEVGADEMMEVAIRSLDADPTSEAWIEVAIVDSVSLRDLEQPFRNALKHQGTPVPSRGDANRYLARPIACRIVRGTIDPESGAWKILPNGFVDTEGLHEFAILSEQVLEWPPLTKEEHVIIRRRIVEAAQRLLDGLPPIDPPPLARQERETWWQRFLRS